MKERLKSVVLVVLVILNLILGSQVLSTKKLWSDDGYNFFANMAKIPITDFLRNITQRITGKAPSQTHLESPELIIINTGYQTSRHALNGAEAEFNELYTMLSEFLISAFSANQQFQQVESADFYSALTAKSVYMRYPTEYDSSLFAYLLGASGSDFSQSFSQLRNIVISSDGSVYIEDSETRKVYRCRTDISTSALNEAIDAYEKNPSSDSPVINYAFDLGFDTAFGTQKTVLSPMIPIYSEGFEVETVKSEQLLFTSSGTADENAISSILALFDMTPNSFRRYTEVDGTTVFVENNAVLKISPDGLIDYSATNGGVLLSKNSSYTSKFDSISAIAEFVDRVNRAAGSDSVMQLSSNMTSSEINGSRFTVSLDYLANGRLVKYSGAPVSNAVSITVEDGRIVSYRHLMRNFSTTNTFMRVDNYIHALDNAIAEFEDQLNEIEISSMEIVYEDNLTSNELLPNWNVKVKEIVIDE